MSETVDNEHETEPAFYLGGWLVEPAASTISCAGKSLEIAPREMDLLCLMASRPREPLSDKDIEAVLWRDAVAGEGAVARLMTKLQAALGETPEAAPYIEESPTTGAWRLNAKVKPAAPPKRKDEGGNLHRIIGLVIIIAVVAWFILARPPSV